MRKQANQLNVHKCNTEAINLTDKTLASCITRVRLPDPMSSLAVAVIGCQKCNGVLGQGIRGLLI